MFQMVQMKDNVQEAAALWLHSCSQGDNLCQSFCRVLGRNTYVVSGGGGHDVNPRCDFFTWIQLRTVQVLSAVSRHMN